MSGSIGPVHRKTALDRATDFYLLEYYRRGVQVRTLVRLTIYADGRKKRVFRIVGKTSHFCTMRVIQNGINVNIEPLRNSKISDSILSHHLSQ